MKFDSGKAIKEIKKRKAKKVGVQVPEGMKTQAPKIAEAIEKETGALALTFIDPCFGACDIADWKAKALGLDLLVHFGHERFVAKHAIETAYVPVKYDVDEKSVSGLADKLSKELEKAGFKKVALFSTTQYLNHLGFVEKILEKKGISVQGKCTVLGCSYSCVKALEGKSEAVAFYGDGLFHALGLGFAAKKPVFFLNGVEEQLTELNVKKELFLRKRIAMIEKAKQAKLVAIWVSTKKGQQKMRLAEEIKKKLQAKGKKALLVASDFISPEYLLGLKAEAIVCTACPRIALDDSSSYKQPILNPTEALIALGEKPLKEYEFDELC